MTAYLLHFSTSPILWFIISFRLLYMQRWEYGACMLSGKNLFYNTSCESHVNLRQYTTHDCGLRLLAHLFWFACFQTEMISTLCYGSSAQITLVTLKRGNEEKINHHYWRITKSSEKLNKNQVMGCNEWIALTRIMSKFRFTL